MIKKLLPVLRELLPAALLLILLSWCANALKGEAFAQGSLFLIWLDPVLAILAWTACPALLKSLFPFALLPLAVWWVTNTSKPFWEHVTLPKKAAMLTFAMLLGILVDGLKGELFKAPESLGFLAFLNSPLHAMNMDTVQPYAKLLLLLLLLGSLVWYLREEIMHPFPIGHLVPPGAAIPHRCLIVPISPNRLIRSDKNPNPPNQFDSSANGVCINGQEIEGLAIPPADWRAARANIEKIGSHGTSPDWKWMMLLRAIYPHLAGGTLRQIVLVGSPDPGGSFNDIDDAMKLIQRVTGMPYQVEQGDPPVRKCPQPVEFESFEKLSEVFRHEIKALRKAGFADSNDVMLDTTAGFKIASITAAMFTLNDEASFQYVHTLGSIAKGTNEIAYQLTSHNASVI